MKKIHWFLLALGAIAIGFFFWWLVNFMKDKETTEQTTPNKEVVESDTTQTVVSEDSTSVNLVSYHVIVGSFKYYDNAVNFINLSDCDQCTILPLTDNGFNCVSLFEFTELNDAKSMLETLRADGVKCWVKKSENY